MPRFEDIYSTNARIGTAIGIAVSVPSSNAVLVNIGGTTATIRVIDGVTVALNDTVLITRHGANRFVTGVVKPVPASPLTLDINAAPPPSDSSPSPKPSVRIGTLICAPVQTATYRDGKWRDDLNAPVNSADLLQGIWPGFGQNTGCAFYGTKPRSLAGATVTGAYIKVRRLSAGVFGAQHPTLRLTTQATRPGGAPTLNESTTGPSLAVNTSTLKFSIPVSWGQAIVNGTRGGIAVFANGSTPYMKFAGRSSWSAAWFLTLVWRR